MANPFFVISLRYKKALHIARLDYATFRVQRGHCGNSPMSRKRLIHSYFGLLSFDLREAYCHKLQMYHGFEITANYGLTVFLALIGNVRIVACMHFDVSDAYLALTMSRMDSINNRILPLHQNKCQYTVEIFTRLALWRLVWLFAK